MSFEGSGGVTVVVSAHRLKNASL